MATPAQAAMAGAAGPASRLWDRQGEGAAMPSRLSRRYTRIQKIGQGTYGEVYRATALGGGGDESDVALKKVRLEDDDTGVPLGAIREVASLKSLRHVNIVALLDTVLEDDVLWLVFEFLPQGDLWRVLDAAAPKGGLSYEVVKDYLRQILCGVSYCHHNQVLHRDLKPGNLLLDAHGTIKVADFGMSRPIRNHVQPYSPDVVTRYYRPPELLLGWPYYSTSVDIWSIGCIFLEMLTGHPPFRGDSRPDQLYRIFEILGTPDEHSWPGLSKFEINREPWPLFSPTPLSTLAPKLCPVGAALCYSMLMYCAEERVSATEALQHPLFKRDDERA